jgi:F0F1-type ATP synthase delta subunit
LKLKQEVRNQLIEKLKQKNSLESILPFIKCLRKDKRALVFAWQCVMQDNQINEKEIVAFNELATVFKIKEAEKEMVKHKAKQFRDLPYELMLEEYFK